MHLSFFFRHCAQLAGLRFLVRFAFVAAPFELPPGVAPAPSPPPPASPVSLVCREALPLIDGSEPLKAVERGGRVCFVSLRLEVLEREGSEGAGVDGTGNG